MGESSTTQWRPTPWFLLTPPRPKPGVLHRPRLDALLDATVSADATTVLLAPSGYGKSTALAAWAERQEHPTAWLTVTRHTGSELQLLSGILSALRHLARTRPALQGFLEVIPDLHDPDLLLERLCDAFRGLADPATIVIDDAHLSSPGLVDAVIDVLREHSGGMARLIVAGSHDLRSWFTTQLTTGTASLLGAEDLAMTEEEVEAAIATAQPAFPAASAADTARAIFDSTRGWPVAVSLALSAPHCGEMGAAPRMSSDDLVADYIVRTVLNGIRPDLLTFILAATTCTRLTAELAEALSGSADSAALLAECVSGGLFIDRYLDGDNDPVYRWHEVFARHCRIANQQADAQRARELNRTAAHWLTARFPTEATVHALRASDPELAAQIISANWLRLVVDSQAAALNSCCLALPPALAQTPEILLIRACCLDVQGDRSGAQTLLARAQAASNEPAAPAGPSAGRTRAFAELFLASDALTLARAADQVRAVLHSAGAEADVDTHAVFLLGWVELRLRRDPAEAVRLLSTAQRDAEAGGHLVLAGRATANLVFASAYGGYFTAARALDARRAAASSTGVDAEWQHYDGGIEYVARGMIEYWQNSLAGAEAQFRILLAQGGHSASYTALARVYFALTAAASGDARLIAEARGQLTGISAVEVHGVPWPAYRALATAGLAAASGERPRALALLEPLQQETTIPVGRVLMAELYRKGGRLGTALQLLGTLHRPGQVSYVQASALVTTAVIARVQGEWERAHQFLERALAAAVPEGIARPFAADADDTALHELLTEHAAWGTAHEGFLAAQITQGDAGVSRDQLVGSGLSPRERDILGYLRTTMTADEIAAVLHVSVNTVRTHQRAIYRKLGVSSRREAIRQRA